MLKDITLGRYYPANSFVHSLDPRTKILFTLAFMVIVFMVDKLWVFLPVAAFICLVTLVSRIPIKYMYQSLKPLRWILLLMFLINLFVIKTGDIIFSFWFLTVTTDSIVRAIMLVVRLVLLVLGTSLMTLTTTPISLTDGIESLLKPLKHVRFPVHELAMMMTIALRFIPTLIDETDRIMKAQMARGADFESGSIIKRAKAMIPIMIPLFISAFRRADELALAMESRCYHGGEGRTRMNVMQYKKGDLMALIYMVVFSAVILLLRAIPI